MWGLGRDWVLGTEAVCSGELQELAVQSPLEEWVSLPCLSAYEEMGTEEPALKTSLVSLSCCGEQPNVPSMLSCRTVYLGE